MACVRPVPAISRRLLRTPAMSRSQPSSLESLRQRYKSALQKFTASSQTFEVIDSLTSGGSESNERTAPSTRTADALYVLDSSFNPPTLAHLHIARSALTSPLALQHGVHSAKLLLLLATQNADKPAKPALFEDRLIMMNLFGQDLLDSLNETKHSTSSPNSNDSEANDTNRLLPKIDVDIGLTSLPYFIDKASSITSSNTYTPPDVQQIHLTGYDTLVRIFEPKYYPPAHTLDALAPFLSRHRLRVTLREDDAWGGGEEQERFLEGLRSGALEKVGGRREWAERIELVSGTDRAKGTVSSTRARDLAAGGDGTELGKIVTTRVTQYVLHGGLYVDG